LDFGVVEKGSKRGFGETACVAIRGIEEGTDAAFGEVDRKFFHRGDESYSIRWVCENKRKRTPTMGLVGWGGRIEAGRKEGFG
jgi:hypothetical protein